MQKIKDYAGALMPFALAGGLLWLLWKTNGQPRTAKK